MDFASPAKVNLFLRIVGKDGEYHSLVSLFQALDLVDDVAISEAKKDVLTCSAEGIPVGSENLACRARTLFRRKTGIDQPFSIHIEKRIPTEAGLGGGSSNAATVLWGINELLDRPAEREQLMKWAAELGSDVPFFFSSGTAMCMGRGEQVKSLPPLEVQEIFIVRPPCKLSTKEVYSRVILSELVDPKGVEGPRCFNDLETAAFSLAPQLAKLKASLQKEGCQQVTLCGSGSCFFCFGKKPKERDSHQIYSAKFLSRELKGWYGLCSYVGQE